MMARPSLPRRPSRRQGDQSNARGDASRFSGFVPLPLATAAVALGLLVFVLHDTLAMADQAAVAESERSDEVATGAPADSTRNAAASSPSAGPTLAEGSDRSGSPPSPGNEDGSALTAGADAIDADTLEEVAADLMRRQERIAEREEALDLREAALDQAQAQLKRQLDRLDRLREEIAGMIEEVEVVEAERLEQLVKVYESMRSKKAAAIFERLELPVIIAVARRMREAKVAAILGDMDPNKARVVTTELAREREMPTLTGSRP